MYKIIAFIFGGVLLVGLGAGAFWFYDNQIKTPPISAPTPTLSAPKNIPTSILTLTPTSTPGPTLSPSPTLIPTKTQADLDGITLAFSKKYSKPVSDITVTISKFDGIHASGGVQFAGEAGGGWFLAYKDVGNWKIIQDGNGTMSCETLEPYDFPTSMEPECVDKNGKLIKR